MGAELSQHCCVAREKDLAADQIAASPDSEIADDADANLNKIDLYLARSGYSYQEDSGADDVIKHEKTETLADEPEDELEPTAPEIHADTQSVNNLPQKDCVLPGHPARMQGLGAHLLPSQGTWLHKLSKPPKDTEAEEEVADANTSTPKEAVAEAEIPGDEASTADETPRSAIAKAETADAEVPAEPKEEESFFQTLTSPFSYFWGSEAVTDQAEAHKPVFEPV